MVKNFKHKYVEDYIKRYGFKFNRYADFYKIKHGKKDRYKELVFMEDDKLYKKLQKEYHPFFASMIYAVDMPVSEIAPLIDMTPAECNRCFKDPINNMTLYNYMRLADLLSVSTDLIIMNVLQRDFNETILKEVNFRKIVEERLWKNAREKQERLRKFKHSHKEILKGMLDKMI